MSQTLIIVSVLMLASVMAFHTPTSIRLVATKSTTSMNMVPVDAVVETSNTLASFSTQLLSAESDFGGYVGPAGSLILIAIIILTLAPPLAPKEEF